MIQVGATHHCRKAVKEAIDEKMVSYTTVQDGGDDGFTIFKVEMPLGDDSLDFVKAGAVFCTEVETNEE